MFYFDKDGNGWTSNNTHVEYSNRYVKELTNQFHDIMIPIDRLFQDDDCLLPNFVKIGDSKTEALNEFVVRLQEVLKSIKIYKNFFSRKIHKDTICIYNDKAFAEILSNWYDTLTER